MAHQSAIDAPLSRANSKAGRLQRPVLRLLLEHQDAGMLPTLCRLLFYELEQRGVIPKHYTKPDGTPGRREPSQDVSDALTKLREVGIAPWSVIVGETRSVESIRTAPTAYKYILGTLDHASIDRSGDEPIPLIITESRSLRGVLAVILDEYAVPVTALNGQSSGSLIHNEIVPLFTDTPDRQIGKQAGRRPT